MYWSPDRLPRMVIKSHLQWWEIHPITLLGLHFKGQLVGYTLRYTSYFSVSKISFVHRFIGYMNFKSLRAKHHVKGNRWCRSDKMGHLINLLDFSPADFKRFPTVLADRRPFGNHCIFRTGLVAIDIHLTKRCSALSSRCDVTCGLLDFGKHFTVLCWVCFLTSRLTTA
jgi:hypothetical protein